MSIQGVQWPTDQASGRVFDLAWLDRETRKPVTPSEQAIIEAALAAGDSDSILWAAGVPSYVRTEYHRQRGIELWGRQFLHQPDQTLKAGDVRGVFYLEWKGHIEQMARDGHLDEALALTCEVIAAAERVDAIDGRGIGAAGWYDRACILLRKLGKYDAEVQLIESVIERYPGWTKIAGRLATARKLARR